MFFSSRYCSTISKNARAVSSDSDLRNRWRTSARIVASSSLSRAGVTGTLAGCGCAVAGRLTEADSNSRATSPGRAAAAAEDGAADGDGRPASVANGRAAAAGGRDVDVDVDARGGGVALRLKSMPSRREKNPSSVCFGTAPCGDGFGLTGLFMSGFPGILVTSSRNNRMDYDKRRESGVRQCDADALRDDEPAPSIYFEVYRSPVTPA